jgi:hypothetical protein
MATSPEDLRAHDRGSKSPCRCQELKKTSGKLFAGHMVGVASKCRVPPSGVRSVRDWSATASQAGKRNVGDSGGMERGLQCRLLILRLTAGAGKAPDIGDYLNPIRR